MSFNGQVAIVTGAAKGIGWGIAKVMAEKGAKVVVVDWTKRTVRNQRMGFAKQVGMHFS